MKSRLHTRLAAIERAQVRHAPALPVVVRQLIYRDQRALDLAECENVIFRRHEGEAQDEFIKRVRNAFPAPTATKTYRIILRSSSAEQATGEMP